MRIAELCSILIIMNMSTLSEYVEKKNVKYVWYQIIMIMYVVSEMYLQDTDVLIVIKIIYHELQNVTKEKNIWKRFN